MTLAYQNLKRTEPLGIIWLMSNYQSWKSPAISKKQVINYNIPSVCNCIKTSTRSISLRISSYLLLGLIRLYNAKLIYMIADSNQSTLMLKVLNKKKANKKQIQNQEIEQARNEIKEMNSLSISVPSGQSFISTDSRHTHSSFRVTPSPISIGMFSAQNILAESDITLQPIYENIHLYDSYTTNRPLISNKDRLECIEEVSYIHYHDDIEEKNENICSADDTLNIPTLPFIKRKKAKIRRINIFYDKVCQIPLKNYLLGRTSKQSEKIAKPAIENCEMNRRIYSVVMEKMNKILESHKIGFSKIEKQRNINENSWSNFDYAENTEMDIKMADDAMLTRTYISNSIEFADHVSEENLEHITLNNFDNSAHIPSSQNTSISYNSSQAIRNELLERLSTEVLDGTLKFSTICCGLSRVKVVLLFQALLDMNRRNVVVINQETPYGDIYLSQGRNY